MPLNAPRSFCVALPVPSGKCQQLSISHGREVNRQRTAPRGGAAGRPHRRTSARVSGQSSIKPTRMNRRPPWLRKPTHGSISRGFDLPVGRLHESATPKAEHLVALRVRGDGATRVAEKGEAGAAAPATTFNHSPRAEAGAERFLCKRQINTREPPPWLGGGSYIVT